MDTENDPVLNDLKTLREGTGLTMGRLTNARHLLDALDTADTHSAYQAIQTLLAQIGDTTHSRALMVDFGWGLENLLGRAPVEREVTLLGDRRSAYANLVARDPKTVTRWSDDTLTELRALIGTEHFTGHILVTAGVQNRRVVGIGVLRYERNEELYSHGRDFHVTNPEAGPSPPLVLYGFPRDWEPSAIHFAVQFLDGQLPENVWALVIDDVFHIGFGHERTVLEPDPGGLVRCMFESPRVDQIYGVWWQ